MSTASGPRADSAGVTSVAHVAIAVHSIDASRPFFEDVLGMRFLRAEDVPTEGVRVAFFDSGNCHIELLEPLDENGAVARFLQRRGEGIHHIALAVDDLSRAMRHIDQHMPGSLLDDSPREAAGGYKAAFLHPKRTFGALIELYNEP